MVKKTQKTDDKTNDPTASLLDSEFANTVKESAQQIWLAGLGAFARAQAEGGKVFDSLVKEGTTMQRKTQSVAEEKLAEVSSRMTEMAGEVSAKAGQQWDKLESIFEERTSRALGKLGVPSAKEVAALAERIDALAAQLARLDTAAARPAAKRAAERATKKRAAARPASAKAPVKRAGAKRAG